MPILILQRTPRFGVTPELEVERQAFAELRRLRQVDRLWLLRQASDTPGPLTAFEHAPIPAGDQTIRFVDPYGGRWPVLYHRGAPLEAGYTPQLVRQAVLFDSNVASRLAQWVNKDPCRELEYDAGIHALVERLVRAEVDLGPLFYGIETTSNDTKSASAPHFRAAVRASITLRTLDRPRFLATGTLAADRDAMAALLAAYQVADRGAALEREVAVTLADDRMGLPHMAALTHVVLLRAALSVGEHVARLRLPAASADVPPRLPPDAAVQVGRAVCRYQRDVVGLITARDRIVVLALVSGALADQVRPPRRGLGARKLRERLRQVRATSWDLALQRVPEFFLATASAARMTVAGYVTMDEGLEAIARAVTTRGVGLIERESDDGAAPQPVLLLGLDLTRLGTRAPIPEVVDALDAEASADMARRRDEGIPAHPALSLPAAAALIADLEAEYRARCAPGASS